VERLRVATENLRNKLLGLSPEEVKKLADEMGLPLLDPKEQIRQSALAFRTLSSGVFAKDMIPIRLSDLRDRGHEFWKISYAHHDDDELAITMMTQEVVRKGRAEFMAAVQTPTYQTQFAGLGLWAHQGFPVVEIGHKRAALFAATRVSKEVIPLVASPWRAFMIALPEGMLQTEVAGKSWPVSHVLVATFSSRGVTGWSYIAHSQVAILHKVSFAAEQFEDGRDERAEVLACDMEMNDADDRAHAFLRRLIVGTCLAISDPRELKKIGRSHSMTTERLRESKDPLVRRFRFTDPVDVDCRPAISAFLNGERRAPSVQVLVAGHWKRQHHGPGRMATKVIHVNPYWRGPEDQPIAVRSHVVPEPEPES
jgi:hypothetical protein